MKLLIVEEALGSLEGHWFEYIRAVAAACRRAGDDVTIACHRDAIPEIIGELQAMPVFPESAWDPEYMQRGGGLLRRLGRIFRHNAGLYRIGRRLLRERGPFDRVFFPTILIDHLGAWTLLAWTARHQYGKMVLFFLNGHGVYRGPGELATFPRTPNTLLTRFLLRLLRPLVRSGKVILAAETKVMSAEYTRLCEVPFQCFAQPVELAAVPAPASTEPSREITLSCFGPARFEKGSDLLQAAIRRVRETRPDLGRVRFVVHWQKDFDGTQGRCTRHPVLLADAYVEFLTRSLTPAEYREQLARTDGMVLPYRASSYYSRGSRMAIESAILGMPMIFTRDTSLDEVVRECGAGLSFENENLDDLTAQLIRLIDEFPAWRRAAAERAPLARRLHSAERFRECLLQDTNARPA